MVKPSVGASGHGVSLVTSETVEASWPDVKAATDPHPIIVREFVPEIREKGQVSFVFLGGRFSHAIRFLPAHGEFRINAAHDPVIEVIHPRSEKVDEAASVLSVLPEAPLYARIDVVEQDGRLLLLEAEVHEPGLLFQFVPEGARRFADATLKWIDKGGPLVASRI